MFNFKDTKTDEEVVEKLQTAKEQIYREIGKIIVGQKEVIEQVLITLLCRGHCIIIGVPGLAKTKIVKTVADIFDLDFKRIQFTPDLMPADITGCEVIEENLTTGGRNFRFIKGPIFGNIILADEINRTPPKTQSALLQAMQEYQVTTGGETYPLELPFFVLATQNPIEQEGTYPLPEAQLDRFIFNIYIDYPSPQDEVEIVKQTTSSFEASVSKIMGKEDIIKLQDIIRKVPISERLIEKAVDLTRSSRPIDGSSSFVKNYVAWGAGPRASQYLVLSAKARAVLYNRYTPSVEDIKSVAAAVLRHRIITNFTAEAEGINVLEVINQLLSRIN